MGNRVLPGQEKVLPLLSFKFPIELTFSIGTTEKLRNQITGDIANLNQDFTTVCRALLLRDLGLKTKADIDLYFSAEIRSAKSKIYNHLGICRGKSFGSDYIITELGKYTEQQKKKRGIKEKDVFENKITNN